MLKSRRSREKFFLLLPVSLCILVFSLYPVLRGIYIGFTDYKIGRPMKFNGIDNYVELIADGYFLLSLTNLLVITLYSLVATYLLSLVLALILNSDIPFRQFWRTIVIIPWAVPPVIKVSVWAIILSSDSGHLNYLLKSLGLIKEYIGWYTNVNRAVLSIVIMIVWGCVPFMTMSLLAGLSTIPIDNYEAASIDGASSLAMFRYITMPYISKVTMVATSLLFIWIANDFSAQYMLTGGGPGAATLTIISEAYRQGFKFGNFGYANSYGNLMIVVMSAILYIYVKSVLNSGEKGAKRV